MQDGAMIRYAADTSTDWVLRFDAITSYWKFVGGAPLTASDSSSVASSVASTFQLVTTPQITAPFAGDYEMYAEALITHTTTSGSQDAFAPTFGGTATPGSYAQVVSTAGLSVTVGWWEKATGVAANAVFQTTQFTNDATPAHCTSSNRRLWVRPIRVH